MDFTYGDIEKELLPFLDRNARADLKTAAIENMVGLTGTNNGVMFFKHSEKCLEAVVRLLTDQDSGVSSSVVRCLVNLSANDEMCAILTTSAWAGEMLSNLFQSAVDLQNPHAGAAASVLSNLTRLSSCAHRLTKTLLDSAGLDRVVEVLCKASFTANEDMQYLASFLMNMTQVTDVRQAMLAPPKRLLQQMIPCITHSKSSNHRRGIVGVVKNCCFEYDSHEWLLSEEVDLLPRLLLPLAGADDLEEEEMEQLPLDVQYLPATHTRDPDPVIRKMLVEALTKLCSTRTGRLFLKEKNIYVILRELHKWEKVEDNIPSILSLVDILIGDEPQKGMEDLHKVDVPVHLQKKFDEDMD